MKSSVRRPAAIAAAALCLLAAGCGMDAKLHSRRMENLASGGAGEVVRELSADLLHDDGEPRRGADTAMLLELGAALSENGDFKKSNLVLETVYKRYVESDDGPVISLKRTGASFAEATISTGLADYDPADFEKIFLHAIKEKNYLLMGDPEGAGVEARRARKIERALRERVDEEKAEAAGGRWNGNVRRQLEIPPEISQKLSSVASSMENPFAMMLTAFTHIARGEIDDALIEIRRAKSVYPSPAIGGIESALEEGRPLPNVFVFALLDRAPSKMSVDVRVIDFYTGALQKLSFPAYERAREHVLSAEASGKAMEPIADVELLAYKEYEDRLGVELLKTFTRLAARTAKDRALANEMKGFGGLVGTITNELLEGADTRSWTMLPRMVYFSAVETREKEISIALETGRGRKTLAAEVNPEGMNLVFVTANAEGYGVRRMAFFAPR